VLKIARETFSPGVRQKVVLTAAETKSYSRAERVLRAVGEVEISDRHIGRIARERGQQLIDEQHQRAAQHQHKELPVEVRNPPELAVVEMDGGRIRTRQAGCGPGTHEPAWRETKNALFQRMSSEEHADDPAPELPAALQNRHRVRQVVLEMSGTADGAPEPPEPESVDEEPSGYVAPKRLLRTCLSSLDEVRTFGRLMAAEAHRKAFYQAPRQAFVADGMKCNWTVWKKHFPTFTPIVDFLHVVSYLYHAAVAVGEEEEFGWGLCLDWTTACWGGRVSEVITELTDWLSDQPAAEGELVEDDPRRIVQKAVTYLTNNRCRMDYPTYRKRGLPITSALMESLIKEINWRVKGTEKFWNDPGGATPILALKAAALCDDNRLENLLTE